eukprot:Platyproteum_vivax@DN5616_c0_g1_i1.p1
MDAAGRLERLENKKKQINIHLDKEQILDAAPLIRSFKDSVLEIESLSLSPQEKAKINKFKQFINASIIDIALEREEITLTTFKYFGIDHMSPLDDENEPPDKDGHKKHHRHAIKKHSKSFNSSGSKMKLVHNRSPRSPRSPRGSIRGSPRGKKGKKLEMEPHIAWHTEAEGGVVTKYRREGDGTYTIRTSGLVKAPMFEVMAVCCETEYSTNWVPMLKKGEKLHAVGKATQVLRHLYTMPWPLGNREVIMKVFGVDMLDDPMASLLLILTSPSADAKEAFGMKVEPPEKGTLRMPMNYVIFILTPKEHGKETDVVILANVDPGIKMIPQSLVSYLAKSVIRLIFDNLTKCVNNFKGSVYEKRVAADPILYGYLKERLADR